MRPFQLPIALLLAPLMLGLGCGNALGCPFCTAEMQTLSEEMADSSVVVIAQLAKTDPLAEGAAASAAIIADIGEARFEILHVLKGKESLFGAQTLQAIYFGSVDYEQRFLIRGIGDPVIGQPLEWAIPLTLSPLAVEYVKQLPELPVTGAERLAFFQPYLEHEDRQLAQDAYDEFARAPYHDLQALKPQINKPRVLQMINDPLISPNRRRLFFTMLGVCGGPGDLPMLEAMLKADARVVTPAIDALVSVAHATGGPLTGPLAVETANRDERRRKLGLDAMIGCYLTLKRVEGLDLIDDRFLADPQADQTHVYAALMALRFLAEEGDIVPHDRMLQSARLLLKNPLFADQVITDLARWEDWTVIDQVGQMFRESKPQSPSEYVRAPIVTYLDVAAEQEGEIGQQAAALIAELEPTAPETFRNARALSSFGFLGTARKMQVSEEADPELASEDDDPLPDPATFGIAETEPFDDPKPAATGQDDLSADTDTTPTDTVALTTTKAVIPAAAEPLNPPNRLLLIVVPLGAAAACFGLFWFILRGSAS